MSKNRGLCMKRKKYWIVFLVLASVIFITGTSAVFLSLSGKNNKVTVGSNEIEIVEDFKLPEHIKAGEETTFQKKVQIKNNGTAKVFVRVKIQYSNDFLSPYITLSKPEGAWSYISEGKELGGYFYFIAPLPGKAMTPELLESVVISADAPRSAFRDFDLIVYAESIQTTYENYKEAWRDYLQKGEGK